MTERPWGAPSTSRDFGLAGRVEDRATELLARAARGDRAAETQAIELLYPLMHELARTIARRWPSFPESSATAALHTVLLRVLRRPELSFASRRCFLGLLARGMEQHWIDLSRRRRAEELPEDALAPALGELEGFGAEVVEALAQLEAVHARSAEVARSHLLLGLTIEQVGELCELGHSTVERDLAFAKAWLRSRLARGGAGA